MRKKIELIKFDWLFQDVQPTSELLNIQDIPWTNVPLSKDIGIGGYEAWFLTNGISIYHANYKFNPAISGQLIPLAKVSTNFAETSLMIQTLVKGRVVQKDQLSTNDLIYGDGLDLFRLSDEV